MRNEPIPRCVLLEWRKTEQSGGSFRRRIAGSPCVMPLPAKTMSQETFIRWPRYDKSRLHKNKQSLTPVYLLFFFVKQAIA